MTKKKLYILIAIVMVLSLGAEIAGIHLHQHWPLPFGYDIFFGFAGCWALIIMAKMIMAPMLQRKEDYYTGGDKNE